ncbi:response regulator [Chryseobacterium sp. 22532]|uniref:response regulator n=1 Tax=Chryseobacterium sp. 22532 TaxID=3453938 RepID=UPI003F82A67D
MTVFNALNIFVNIWNPTTIRNKSLFKVGHHTWVIAAVNGLTKIINSLYISPIDIQLFFFLYLQNILVIMTKKVVLVQDNEAILDIMDQVLKEEGFDVTSSLTTEPIEKIDEIEPDVVIVDDYIKGNKKGSEVIEELKSVPETEDISAVLTSTAHDLPEKAKECKADDYIEKPFDIDHMIEVVKKNS